MASVITWEIWSRVVRFVGERERPGTAFLIGTGPNQFLVTARHLCTDEPEEIVSILHPWTNDAQVFHDNGTRVGLAVAPTADFAVFKLSEPIADVGGEVLLNADGFRFSQIGYILGYPYGISLRPQSSSQQFPIVKSCIIGGIETDADGVQSIYIDAMVNPGFSGGPLVFVHPETGKPCVAGVVVRAVSGPLKEAIPGEPEPPIGPAGIGIVTSELTFRDAVRAVIAE